MQKFPFFWPKTCENNGKIFIDEFVDKNLELYKFFSYCIIHDMRLFRECCTFNLLHESSIFLWENTC